MAERETFDTEPFRKEINDGAANPIATRVLLENERVRIWEIRMAPGERVLFHRHVNPYLWVCVDGGKQRSRRADGTTAVDDMQPGMAYWSEVADGPETHSIENVGDTTIRFTTVEILAEMTGSKTERQYGQVRA